MHKNCSVGFALASGTRNKIAKNNNITKGPKFVKPLLWAQRTPKLIFLLKKLNIDYFYDQFRYFICVKAALTRIKHGII